jgi:hypothetical protein
MLGHRQREHRKCLLNPRPRQFGVHVGFDAEEGTADGFLQRALDASRRGNAGLEYEPRMLAFQADNLARAGDPRRAGDVAAEAIGVARRKADRLAECHARLVAAEAYLAQSGSPHAQEIRSLLMRANALIDETGAKAYEAMMLRVRAQASDEKNLAPPRRS